MDLTLIIIWSQMREVTWMMFVTRHLQCWWLLSPALYYSIFTVVACRRSLSLLVPHSTTALPFPSQFRFLFRTIFDLVDAVKYFFRSIY